MIEFKTLKFSNLCSYGDAPFSMSFDDAKVWAFTGHNGSGKSTILDAIAFTLYGKPWRKVPKGKLVNTRNKRGTRSEITFSTERHEYSVVRGIKPDLFEIRRDGELINQDSKARDYQKVLEDDILKLSWQAFNQVVIVGKATYVPFMQLESAQRRGFVESVLGLQIFTAMKELLRGDNTKAVNALSAASAGLDALRPQVGRIETTLASYNKMADDGKDESVEAMQELVATITAAIADEKLTLAEVNSAAVTAVQVQTAQIAERVKQASQANSAANLSLTHAITAHEGTVADAGVVSTYIQGQTRERDFLKSKMRGIDTATACPSCGAPIDASSATAHLAGLCAQVDEFDTAIFAAAPDLAVAKDAVALAAAAVAAERQLVAAAAHKLTLAHACNPTHAPEVQAAQQAVTAQQAVIREMEADLRATNERLTAAERRERELAALIEKATTDLEEATAGVASKEGEVATALTTTQILDATGKMLRDTGVKATIISKYIPVINKVVNQLLADMGFFARFELDSEFNDKILARGFEEMTYNSFSEGEKLRIDMAVLLAWRELCILTGSSSTNLIIFDEILDASFDQVGLDSFMTALTQKDNLHLVCITHHVDRIDHYVEKHLAFTKTDGYSGAVETTE